jgi:hypothetical protein
MTARGGSVLGWALRVAALGGLACEGCGPQAARNAEPRHQAATLAASVGEPDRGPAAHDSSNTSTPAPAESAAQQPVVSPIEVARWMKEQGISGPPPVGACSTLQAGVPLAPALVCRDEDVRLYRAENGTLHSLWSAERVRGVIRLALAITRDGALLEVTDAPGECEQLYAEATGKALAGIPNHGLIEYVARTCDARGRFVWSDGKYVRAPGERAPSLDGEIDPWR